MGSIRTWLQALLAVSSLFAGAAIAQNYDHSVYLDLDNNAATGCSAVTPAGTVNGAEARVTATVTGNPPTVTGVTRSNCEGGVFGPPAPQLGSYAVGLNNGTNGADVIELSRPLAGLDQAALARFTFASTNLAGGDLASGTFALPGSGQVSPTDPILVPATGIITLLLLAGLVFVVARRHPGIATSAVVVLMLGAGVVWAANFVVDGQVGDWAGVPPIATDPANDATGGDPRVEIVAVFAAIESGNLYLRFDVLDAQIPTNTAPVATDAAFSLAENSPATTAVGGVAATDANAGQTLAYAITAGNAAGAFAINAATGAITVANATPLDFETTPQFVLTVTVTDNGVPVMSDTAAITINLTNANEAPVLADAARAVAEDSAAGTAVGAPLVATDPDAGATFTYAITAGNTNGAFAISNTGQITVANAAEVANIGSFALTVSVTDNGGLTDTAAITVTVTDQNDAPVFTNEPYAFSLQENRPIGTVAGTVTSTDSDVGQVVSYAITGGNTGGAFAVNAAGQVTVANAAAIDFEANPSFTLTVTATDNGGVPLSDTATVTITLTDVNEAPTATDGVAAVAENAPVGTNVTTVAATDPDIDPPNPPSANATLTFAITAGNTGNAFTINANTGVISTAAAVLLANSPYALTVTVTDGGAPNLSDTATITINVTDQNDAPVLNDVAFGVPENSANGSNVGTVTATDPDAGQTFTYSITAGNGAGGFAINAATGQITVANSAALDFETTPSFVLTVNVADNGAPSLNDTAQVTINLTNVNDPPVAPDDSMTVAENTANGTLVDTYAATDPDGNTLSYAITGGTGTGVFAINANTGAVTVANAAALDFEAASNFTLGITVTDNGAGNLTDTAVITITLTNVNEAPTASDASFSVLENSANGTAVGSATATDPDAGDTLSYAITAGNTNGAFAINASSGAITVANQAEIDFGVVFNLVVTVTDPGALTDTAAVTITVDDVNEAPTAIQLSNNAVAENSTIGTVVGALTTTDPDVGNTHTYSLACATPGANDAFVSIAGSNLATAQPIDFETTPSLSICVRSTDGGGLFVDQNFTLTVTNVDDAPTAVNDVATVAEDAASTPIDVLTNDTDPDGGPKTVTSVTQPANGTVTLLAGVVGYQPNANYCNTPPGTTPDTFTYQLTPGGSSATVSVSVTCTNDAPVVAPSGGATAFNEDGPPVVVDGGLTVTDIDSAQLVSAIVSITGNFNAAQDALAFTPSGGINGSYDGGTGILSLSGAASPSQYQAVLQSVTYNNTSMNPVPATRQVSFVVNDGALASNVGNKIVNVASSNDAPVVTTTGGSTAVTEDAAGVAVDSGLTVTDVDDTQIEGATISISANFQAGDTLSFVPQGGVTGAFAVGTLTLSGSTSLANYEAMLRSVSFSTTNANPSASKTVQFVVNDGDVNSAPGLKALVVTGVNDAPVITTTAGSQGYTENALPTVIDFTLTLVDPDSTNIASATVAITGNFVAAQDLLGFVNQSGISGSYNPGSGVLSLTGSATVAAYQAALASVTYSNSSEGPAPLSRTISFSAIDDAAAASNVATRGIAITAVNDPPSAVGDTGTTDEDTPLNVPAAGVLANDTDLDPGDSKTVVLLNGSGTLTGTSAQGGTVVINGNGSYTYTPAASFQGLSTGQQGADSFTYTMSDGAGAQSTATVNLTINGVSDAPTAVADSFDAIGNTGLFVGTTRPATQAGKEIIGSLLTNDTDPDTAQASLVAEPVTNAPTTLGGTITIESDGNFTYHPDDVDTGVTDTFTYRVCDATPCNAGTVANATGTLNLPIAGQVWYVRNNEPAGGDGTSDTPFDTLAEAEAASGTGDTVFVFDGSNTTTNLDTGYAMNANERLIGESRPLSLDPDGGGPLPTSPLHPGTSGAQPTLTASNEDVVVLASTVLVDGVNLDPAGTGGGIFGGAGTDAVTVQNVNVIDTGTAGTQPGIEMDGTTGVNRFTGVTVTNGGSATAIGVRINNADRVLFANTATNTISTTGAKALDATSTNLQTSRWNDIIVTGSGTGAIRLSSITGQPVLGDGAGTDLSLQTTSGATAALDIASSNTVTVDSAGTDTISATGGPAMDIRNSNGSQYFFDSATSINSAGDGVNLDTNLTAPVVINGGTIAGAAGIAFDVNGGGVGGGGVVYDGAINDGPGQSVEVTGRDGGGVTFSGNIADGADAGGGVAVSGNSAGSTTFSGASKVLNTGAGIAANLTTNPGHAISFNNGGLDIDTTSGNGFVATGGGTITVQGAGNSIASGTGIAINVANTTIGAGNLSFVSVSANGAVNGIVLNATGAAGGLRVTGNGNTSVGGDNSGGTIQATTGHGISLAGTSGPSFTNLRIQNTGGHGIDGTGVVNFTFANGAILSAGDANSENSINFDSSVTAANVSGVVSITRSVILQTEAEGIKIVNHAGTISNLTVTENTLGDTGDVATPGSAVLLGVNAVAVGNAAELTRATLSNNTITDFRAGAGFVIQGNSDASGAALVRIGTPGSGTDIVSVTNNLMNGGNGGVGNQPDRFITTAINGTGVARIDISDNGTAALPIRNIDGVVIEASLFGAGDNAPGTVDMDLTVNNNFIVANNAVGSSGLGIGCDADSFAGTADSGTLQTVITGNNVSLTDGPGIYTLARGSSCTHNVRIAGNTVAAPNTTTSARAGIRVDSGSAVGDTTLCVQLGTGNVTAGSTNTGTATISPGINLRKQGAIQGTNEFGIEGLAPSPTGTPTVENFVNSQNTSASGNFGIAGTALLSATGGFQSCNSAP